MLQRMTARRRRILMTVDAVGGVWQYTIGLAQQLTAGGDTVVLAGLGPRPTPEQSREAEAIATVEWLSSPPDWLANGERELDGLGGEIAKLVRAYKIDLVQVNEPGQAAHLTLSCPVLAVSHSCIATWFRAVRGSCPPKKWAWQEKRTLIGMQRAQLVVAPTASHGAALRECYGPVPHLVIVHNASCMTAPVTPRDNSVFAAGRWWDDGKNGHVLERAAILAEWPIFAAGATSGPNGCSIAFQNVVALGTISHTQVRNLAGKCGLFVSPSLYEPFGLAALEAAAGGAPLLLADIPTYRELWGGAAVFFAPHDHKKLAAEINRLAGDDRLRRELAAAARRRGRLLTPQRQAASMRQAYDKAEAIMAGRD